MTMKKYFFSLVSILFFCTMLNAATNADTNIYVSGAKHPLRISLPADYNASVSYPLVIGMHYCGGNSNEYRNALKPLCDSLNVIVACPDNNSQQMTNKDFILATIDTARSMFNIDTASVYLTGMSCNGYYTVQQGLKEVYPFRGIFPWDAWIESFNSNTFNLNSTIPTVLSIGSDDPNYATILKLYDSLEIHGNVVDLVLVQGIAHTLGFSAFSNEMIRCYYYLNDTDAISIDTIPVVTMKNTEPPVEVKVKVVHKTGANLRLRALSSNTLLAANPVVTKEVGSDTAVIRITPNGAMRDGVFKIILEAAEVGGTAIEQRIFVVNMQDGPVSSIPENELNNIEIYPVPASSQVYIRSNENKLYIQILDIHGREVYRDSNFNTSTSVDISMLPKGIYFFKTKGLKLDTVVRLIKE